LSNQWATQRISRDVARPQPHEKSIQISVFFDPFQGSAVYGHPEYISPRRKIIQASSL